MARLTAKIPGVQIVGHRSERLPNNIHFCVEGVEGEPMLLSLDAAGICASAGSACAAGSTEPSHVLRALGIGSDLARGALRLTLGRSTTSEALDYTLETLCATVRGLRGLSGPASGRSDIACP
jgi:cysteine desulfurase